MTTIAVVSAGLSQPSATRLLADRLAAATAGELPDQPQITTIELRDLAHDIVNNLLTGFRALRSAPPSTRSSAPTPPPRTGEGAAAPPATSPPGLTGPPPS